MNSINPFCVETTAITLEDLQDFGIEVGEYEINPVYEKSHGSFWKPAGWIRVFDSGRFRVSAQSHLNPYQRRVLAAVAQQAYREGLPYLRTHGYKRVRKSKKVAEAHYRGLTWVRVTEGEDRYEELQLAVTRDYAHNVPDVLHSLDDRTPISTSQ